MNFQHSIRRLSLVATLCVSSLAGVAHASPVAVSGNFGVNGYDTFNFTVSAPAAVDMVYTSGYGDPTFSLFTNAGAHIITNDDSNSLYSHLTQYLNTGAYTMLVSFCCSSANYAITTSAPYSSTDSFNGGSYWVGGTGTLTGMQNFIAATYGAQVGRQPYALTMSNIRLGNNNVPEPTSLALVGLALAATAVVKRRKPAQA